MMIVAEVLHAVRWAAPWDDSQLSALPDVKANGRTGDLKMRQAKAVAIVVIGLAAGAIGMGAATGLADASLFAAKSRCVMVAAAGRALNWDGGHAGLVLR